MPGPEQQKDLAVQNTLAGTGHTDALYLSLCRAGIRGILQVMRKLDLLPPGRGKTISHAVMARSTSWV
ncbi:MAG: hypothetical protein P8Z67_06070, partial [Gammaproteobacteria bacterium]